MIKIGLAGTPATAVAVFNELLKKITNTNISIEFVLTKGDLLQRTRKQGKQIVATPVKQWAKENKIKVFDNVKEEDFLNKLKQVDTVFVVAYGVLITQDLLGAPRFGWLNLHYSSLPKYRGAAPAQWAILNGEKTTSATIFQIDKGLDTGKILSKVDYKIKPQETTSSLIEQLNSKSVPEILTVLQNLKKYIANAIEQNENNATTAPKITQGTVQLNWENSIYKIDRTIRGAWNFPVAWTTFNKQKIFISPIKQIFEFEKSQIPEDFSTQVDPISASANCGKLLITKKEVAAVGSNGILVLDCVKPQGKNWMKAADWARGINQSEKRFF